MPAKFMFVVGLIVIGGLLLGVAALNIFPDVKNVWTIDATDKPFTAVFLTNDQVYFGRVVGQTARTLTLTDVYYLRTNSGIASSAATPPPAPTADNVRLLLVKLGSELHRPTNEIQINREHVLFTEEMSSTGPIMEAIQANLGGNG